MRRGCDVDGCSGCGLLLERLSDEEAFRSIGLGGSGFLVGEIGEKSPLDGIGGTGDLPSWLLCFNPVMDFDVRRDKGCGFALEFEALP